MKSSEDKCISNSELGLDALLWSRSTIFARKARLRREPYESKLFYAGYAQAYREGVQIIDSHLERLGVKLRRFKSNQVARQRNSELGLEALSCIWAIIVERHKETVATAKDNKADYNHGYAQPTSRWKTSWKAAYLS